MALRLTPQLLAAATGCSLHEADRWAEPLQDAMERFGILSPLDGGIFLGQVAHESRKFTRVEETLYYTSIDRLRAVWPTTLGRKANWELKRLLRNPERLANTVYANRYGNGRPETGDGWLYRGRGLIQITFRDNYRACGQALGLDLENMPELLEIPAHAAASAGWFYGTRVPRELREAGDIEGVTRRINGSTLGLEDRAHVARIAAEVLA